MISLYVAGFLLIAVLFFILLPLAEIVNLQLAPSVYLGRKGVPDWLVRILTIPLFPLNLLCGIFQKYREALCDEYTISKMKGLLYPLFFFMLIPCLLI
jgi:hypothetical protein